MPTSRGRVVALAVAGGCYAGAGAQAVQSLVGHEAWDWVEMLASGMVYALVSALIGASVRAGWFVSRDQREGRALVRAALAAGALPSGARPEAWRRFLAQEVHELRQNRWIVGVLSLLLAALVAGAAVVANDNAWPVWVLAVVLAGFVVVPVRWLSRRANRAEALLAQVDAG